jgi:hypothetical protein
MPLLTQKSVGGVSVVPSNVNLRDALTTIAGGAVVVTSPTLYVNGLPQLVLWTQQDPGSAGLSLIATLEFSVRLVGGTEEWLTLSQFTIPAGGVTGLFQFVMPCNAIRVSFTPDAVWAANVTVDYVLAGYGP